MKRAAPDFARTSTAARALLFWLQADLSNAIKENGGKLSVTAKTAFERGGSIRASNAALIVSALEKTGGQFIPENGGGAGVRLRNRSTPGDADQ